MLGFYYLVDSGYTNCSKFLAPLQGLRYHLNSWADKHQLVRPQEFFNMKHASTRNVIANIWSFKIQSEILSSPCL